MIRYSSAPIRHPLSRSPAKPRLQPDKLLAAVREAEAAGREAARANSRAVDCPHRDDDGDEWILRQAWQRGYREECEGGRREYLARALTR